MKQYIFTSDYQAAVNQVGGTITAPIAIFKKGDVYPLENFLNGFIFSKPIPNDPQHLHWGYFIPKSVVKEYNIKNQTKNETMASSYVSSKPYIGNKQSSYIGESVMSKEKEENLKNAFAVIGALFMALIIYVYIMEFKNLQ